MDISDINTLVSQPIDSIDVCNDTLVHIGAFKKLFSHTNSRMHKIAQWIVQHASEIINLQLSPEQKVLLQQKILALSTIDKDVLNTLPATHITMATIQDKQAMLYNKIFSCADKHIDRNAANTIKESIIHNTRKHISQAHDITTIIATIHALSNTTLRQACQGIIDKTLAHLCQTLSTPEHTHALHSYLMAIDPDKQFQETHKVLHYKQQIKQKD